MKKNFRRKQNKPQDYPQITPADFELYVTLQIEDMINADRCNPVVDNYGTKSFGASGLRDEGYGVIVRCKDGSKFVLKISALTDQDETTPKR